MLTSGNREDIVIAIGALLSNMGVSGILNFKNELKTILMATKEGTEDYQYKNITGVLTKELLRVLKELSSEQKEHVKTLLDKFSEHFDAKPKRLMAAYMKFSVEYCKRPEMKSLSMIERAPKVKQAWEKLSDAEKAKYEPTDAEKKAYENAKKKHADVLKQLKTGVIPGVPLSEKKAKRRTA